MSKELLDYFDFNANTPSVSAYPQQRAKVLPEAFEYLFHTFTQENMPTGNDYFGYRLIACNGSNLSIPTNPNEDELFDDKVGVKIFYIFQTTSSNFCARFPAGIFHLESTFRRSFL